MHRYTIARMAMISPILTIVTHLVLAAFGARALPVAEALTFPAARLEIVIRKIDVLDDRDGGWLAGSGELHLYTELYQCLGDVPCLERLQADDWDSPASATNIYHYPYSFKADTGQTKTLDLVYPETSAPVSRGFDISPTGRYVLRFYIKEWDDASGDEDMGEVFQELDIAEHGLGFGTHIGRATGADSNHVGDYILHYEIRRAPLPDLRIGGIQVQDVPGTTDKRVCVGVVNSEAYASGAFEVSLGVDDKLPRTPIARLNGLGGGTSELACTNVTLPATEQVMLSAMVDESHLVDEFNELNNTYKQPYTVPAAAKTAPKVLDLSVAEIKVIGQETDNKNECKDEKKGCKDEKGEPKEEQKDSKGSNNDPKDSKNDCKDGTNTVVVTIQNTGSGSAQNFVVQLAADDLVVALQTVDILGAGQSRDVSLDDVQLKKGRHELVATADVNETVAENDEQNNTRTVTVRCG